MQKNWQWGRSDCWVYRWKKLDNLIQRQQITIIIIIAYYCMYPKCYPAQSADWTVSRRNQVTILRVSKQLEFWGRVKNYCIDVLDGNISDTATAVGLYVLFEPLENNDYLLQAILSAMCTYTAVNRGQIIGQMNSFSWPPKSRDLNIIEKCIELSSNSTTAHCSQQEAQSKSVYALPANLCLADSCVLLTRRLL